MLELWNDAAVLPPPVHTCPCDQNMDLDDLLYVCKEMSRILTKQSPLHREAAILSRFLYKYDKKFRNDIGFRNFKKVNTALRKYLALNFYRDVDNFSSTLPSADSEDFYLPTRQMLEYLLVRLQTFSKLMLRICVCSKQAAVFYLDRIKRGESHWMSLMPYAVLSRIWSMTSVLLNHACSWYKQLHESLDKLQLQGIPFLPENYALPLNLRDWLDIENLDDYGRYEWSRNKCVEVTAILGVEDENDGFDIFQYVNEINDPQDIDTNNETEALDPQVNLPVKMETSVPRKILPKLDHGQSISRDSFKMLTELKEDLLDVKYHRPTVKKHSIEKVTGQSTLKQFLIDEEEYRNSNSEQAVTGHLSFMQWQALKNNLLKLCNPLVKDRKVVMKFQKIWKEKCSDYW